MKRTFKHPGNWFSSTAALATYLAPSQQSAEVLSLLLKDGSKETMNNHEASKHKRRWQSDSGKSMIEVLAVVAIASILTAVAVPQMISARRLMRSASLPREIATQMRFARQQAMSQRQAFTFQYDDSTKVITIIDHNASGAGLLTATGYPNTAGSTAVLTVPLGGGGGLPSSEISFGVPSVISGVTSLDDTSTPTSLASTKLTITFQPNGTVVDANNIPVNRTLFLYNNKVPTETACAISVLGAAGRIKIWRYTASASKYVE
jgi:Tfp pilus assembly protein FimT